MNRKALFFDVDGTLLSEKTHKVPESAAKALEEARKNGHLIFINSGRTICHLGVIKGMIEADGYLCGCGTYIQLEGKEIYSCEIPHARGIEIRQNMKKYGIEGLLEAKDSCYMAVDKSDNQEIERMKASLKDGGVLSEKDMFDETVDFDKFCIQTDENSNADAFFETLAPDICVIDRGSGFFECVPAGHSKATAIEAVLRYYGISLEDAYVFGDSANDLPMFEYVENSILMGKHDKELEPYAAFITKNVEEDGVAFAMKELGIL